MAYTAAQKKELSKDLYMRGYTKARAAELLDISDSLSTAYWAEWLLAGLRINEAVDTPTIITNRGEVLAAEHGAGAIGTAFAPRTYRWIENELIITEIHVDITGLGCKGDAQGDAIGLNTGGAAYIGRYVIDTCGIVYKIEMICVETPAEGTATFEQDIDLMAEDDADVAYDGPVDDTVIAAARDWVAGEHAVNVIPKLTANDYLYLGEGDTGATTGVYSAGQFIIRLYGRPALVA